MTRLRRIAGKAGRFAAQSGIILLITLALLELVLRTYQVFFPSFVFASDSYNRFRGKPHSRHFDFRLNSQGFKDLEFTSRKDDVYRIVAIGDSFAFGVVPYEENYLTLLEGNLQQGTKAEVLNLGMPGIGPKDYVELFVKEGLPLQPDMLLLSFFVGNDFLESKRSWVSYSYAASLLYFLVSVHPKFQGRDRGGSKPYCDDCPSFDHYTYLGIARARSFPYFRDDPQFERLLPNALHYLKRLQAICRKRGITLTVVLIPDELQINRELQRQVRKRFLPQVADAAWDPELPNRRLGEEMDALGIVFIDLYPDFVSSPMQPLYRPRDTHWNIAGNRLAATAIARRLAGQVDAPKRAATLP